MHTPDLLNCEREPIHIPGKIQRHGFLLAIDTSSRIKYCSENIHEYLSVTAEVVLNNPVIILDKYFKKKDRPDLFLRFIQDGVKTENWEFTNPFLLMIKNQPFHLIISRSGEYYLLEFEPAEADPNAGFHQLVGKSLSVILANTQLPDFLLRSAVEIRKIIQYDRVMIYKFHEDGHGEVVAEDKEDSLSPFLGLHYPASDIPVQARQLYKINLVRLIADVHQDPVGILTHTDHVQTPLDLTHSVLRAVSPVHIQYLKNMKVASSFSISLIHRGKLWGLIACHHYSPRFINYTGRQAASFVGEVISSTLGFQQQEEDQQKKHKFDIAVETLAKQLSQASSIQNALFEKEITLLHAVNATGAMLVMDNKIYKCGRTPDAAFIHDLINWLNINMLDQLYISNRFPLEFSPAQNYKESCNGILALRLSKELNDYLIWLRPEVISIVNWAGNPDKPVEFDENDMLKISPRKSFEKWAQKVLNTSIEWESEDVNSALQLRDEVASSIISKAAEIRKANEKLNEAYNTLDAFSYTISHDLRTPLTIINAYGQMLQEDYGSDPEAKSKIEGILSGTHKMDLMIRRILHYSQIGQSDIKPVHIKMENLLHEIRQEALFINNHPSTQIIIKNTPDLFADATMIMQIFSNLITNAVKYSSRAMHPLVIIDGKDTASHIEYSITDNGIGIKDNDKEKIFELFTRSIEVADFEGSGVGLSIVKRIMEKHDGRIRVESDGKLGSTFIVSFQKPEEDANIE